MKILNTYIKFNSLPDKKFLLDYCNGKELTWWTGQKTFTVIAKSYYKLFKKMLFNKYETKRLPNKRRTRKTT